VNPVQISFPAGSVARWFAALAAIFALVGCVGQSDLDQIRNDQMQIRSMIATQNQEVLGLQQQLARQHDELEEMSHGPGGSQNTSNQVAALQDRLSKLEASVSAMQTGTVSPPTAGGSAPVSPPSASPPAPAPAPAAESTPDWRGDLDRELAATISGPGARPYRDGLQAMKDGRYPDAIAKFSLLQKRFPKSPLTEPGEYFSANALFESGRYDQSILQFNDLVMRYPTGRFASAALLREAAAFLKLNDKIDARLTLQKLLADHADSPEATPANEMMKDLDG
jgi:TolA-binding protein